MEIFQKQAAKNTRLLYSALINSGWIRAWMNVRVFKAENEIEFTYLLLTIAVLKALCKGERLDNENGRQASTTFGSKAEGNVGV